MGSVIDNIAARLLRTRWFVRSPIWLYRHGLGRLLGARILLLEHTGRKSGLPRYVCLEVVERPGPGTFVIVSGFGARSQWYQNLGAQPECKVSTGRLRSAPAIARMMSEDEAAAALERYRREHPSAWRRLKGALEADGAQPTTRLPMVALTVS